MDRDGDFRQSLADWSSIYVQASRVASEDLKIGKSGIYLITRRGKTDSFRLIPWEQFMEQVTLKVMPSSAES